MNFLVDSGACASVLRGDIARKILLATGRPFKLKMYPGCLVSLSGHPLDIEGILDIDIDDVGPVHFVVVKNCYTLKCIDT